MIIKRSANWKALNMNNFMNINLRIKLGLNIQPIWLSIHFSKSFLNYYIINLPISEFQNNPQFYHQTYETYE